MEIVTVSSSSVESLVSVSPSTYLVSILLSSTWFSFVVDVSSFVALEDGLSLTGVSFGLFVFFVGSSCSTSVLSLSGPMDL